MLLAILAVVIVIISLWYSNQLVREIASDEKEKLELWAEAVRKKANLVNYTQSLFEQVADEERKRIEIWAHATKRIAATNNDEDRNFYLDFLASNTTIPVIATDEDGNITTHRNVVIPEGVSEDSLLEAKLADMQAKYEPIVINTWGNQQQRLYYNDSRIFSELKSVLDDLIKSFLSDVIINAVSVPVIFTDSTKTHAVEFGNLDSASVGTPEKVAALIAIMEQENDPIKVQLGDDGDNYIYYRNSKVLTKLTYYPVIQFIIIGVFLFIAYYLFSTSRRAEQNQVWVGMAKETAHQLGTPLSSLIAWKEYLQLKEINIDKKTLLEITKDLKRLETITERFSKIGSRPSLKSENVVAAIEETAGYLRSRVSKNVEITVTKENGHEIYAKLNASLFSWVLENLIKNAVDAMEGKGKINIHVMDQVQYVYIDISDTGKGIPRSKQKTVFEPGYTSKERGWGLGLSLAKRIIENYHSGNIFVKHSEPGKGTTFRIVLNK